MKHLFLLLLLFKLSVPSFSEEKKQLNAARIKQSPKIDGVLEEEVWKNIPFATDFIEKEPRPGGAAKYKTEVKIIYDDNAIYIGATMYYNSPDSILCELCQRDNEANADLFGLVLDTYNDDINAYGFFTTSAGVQIDARYSSNGQDFNWNAVWQSQVKINEKDGLLNLKYLFLLYDSQIYLFKTGA